MIRPLYFYYTDYTPSYLSVTRYFPDAEHIDTSPSSYAYWDELEKRWDGSADLLLMEQHIVIHDQVLPQLEKCGGDWCVFPVGNQFHGLSCTRFSARLQQAVPASEIRARARRKCPHCGSLHFAFIDGPIMDAIRPAGFHEPCIHAPPVDHLPE
jgi:hypothetical protein